MFTKDFHKEHKELNYTIFYLCPLCILSVLCGKKSLLRQPHHTTKIIALSTSDSSPDDLS